jgi:hypothetical protein
LYVLEANVFGALSPIINLLTASTEPLSVAANKIDEPLVVVKLDEPEVIINSPFWNDAVAADKRSNEPRLFLMICAIFFWGYSLTLC